MKEVGGFDTSYRYHADYELMLRLFSERRISSVYIPEILVRMRKGGQSNSSIGNIVKGNLESYAAARKHGVARTPWWIVRKLWMRVPQLFSRPKDYSRYDNA
jgi:glycosyltransferase